jgi:hypothetical protein
MSFLCTTSIFVSNSAFTLLSHDDPERCHLNATGAQRIRWLSARCWAHLTRLLTRISQRWPRSRMRKHIKMRIPPRLSSSQVSSIAHVLLSSSYQTVQLLNFPSHHLPPSPSSASSFSYSDPSFSYSPSPSYTPPHISRRTHRYHPA